MDDLISRRAAIDALAEQIMESALMDNPTTASTDIDSYRPIAELSLRDVPSAQPEHLVKESGNLVKGLVNDCISRQAAIDAVKQHMNNVSGGNDEYYIAHRHIIELLQIVPTAEPESHREWHMKGYRDAQPGQRWTPVTEALPRDDEEVIVTCLDDSGDTPYSYTTVAWHYKGMWVCDNTRCLFVIAWMSLPESYREKKSHEQSNH